MTNDQIIKLAREAGFNWPEIHTTTIEERLERFAALVAAAEREACANLCEEACANLCEETYDLFVSKKPSRASALDAAEAIRARKA